MDDIPRCSFLNSVSGAAKKRHRTTGPDLKGKLTISAVVGHWAAQRNRLFPPNPWTTEK
jgi:hypothetical protein